MFGTYRFLLACLVALSHFGLIGAGFNPGQWAVLSFYVLSGFLMEKQIARLASTRAFYIDRFLRVFPLFITVLSLAAILTRPTGLTFTANILLFPLNYSLFTNVPIVIGPTWSLACEAHFYLLIPLLTRLSVPLLRVVFLSSVGLFMSSPFLANSTFWAYIGLPGILFAFVAGILIARKDFFFLRLVWLLFSIQLAAFAYSKISHLSLPTGIHINVCIGFLAALPIIVKLANLSSQVHWDKHLGLLSYPLFLVHEPLKVAVAIMSSSPNMFLLLSYAVATSWILFFLIEKPFEHFRYKLRKAPTKSEKDARLAVLR